MGPPEPLWAPHFIVWPLRDWPSIAFIYHSPLWPFGGFRSIPSKVTDTNYATRQDPIGANITATRNLLQPFEIERDFHGPQYLSSQFRATFLIYQLPAASDQKLASLIRVSNLDSLRPLRLKSQGSRLNP